MQAPRKSVVSSTGMAKEDMTRSRSDFNSTQQISKSKPLEAPGGESMEEVKEESKSRVSKLFSQFNSRIAKAKGAADKKWKRNAKYASNVYFVLNKQIESCLSY